MSNVVITGMGACTELAGSVQDLWNIVKKGPGPKDEPIAPLYQASHKNNDLEVIDIAQTAVHEALNKARLLDGIRIAGIMPDRVGCTFSASKPFLSLAQIPNSIAPLGQAPFGKGSLGIVQPEVVNEVLRERLGVHGESRNVIAACATGAYSVVLGASWIEQGLCDVVISGSVEPPAHPLIEAGFRQMGVVSEESVMRPFDRRRSGFVLSHGAGAVVLESLAHARKREAPILAWLSGWGWGADTHSAVAFNSNGARIADVITRALKRAALEPRAVRHLNAHGTATRLNDWIETQALIKAFGRHADRLMISATKSATGHLLGAAGSVELVLTVEALRRRFVPPTLHLDEPDPSCPLDYTPRRGHAADFDHAVSLSFGFGGPIGALIVSRAA